MNALISGGRGKTREKGKKAMGKDEAEDNRREEVGEEEVEEEVVGRWRRWG